MEEARPGGHLNGTESTGRYLTPAVDITETSDDYLLQVEMPGVGRDGLEVTLEESRLTLIGRRRQACATEAVHRESTSCDFRRVFVVPPGVDTGRIDARLEDGLLSVRLPKAERVKARRIDVNG